MSRMDPSLADRTSSKGREPGASPREHRSNPGRSPERAGQVLELVRPPACPRPMTSGSGLESGYRHRAAAMFDPDSDSDPGTEGILRTAFRVRGSFATGTPGGPRFSANPGLSAATPSALGKGAGENAGSFAVDMRGGVLVLEPMGTCQEDGSVWSVTPEAWERLARGAKRPRVHGVFVANPGGVEEFQGGFAPPPGCGFTTRRVVPGCVLRTTRGYRLSSLRDDILTLPMTGGGGQDGRDEQDGGWPRGGVEGGPEAPRWESRRYSRRGCGGHFISGLFPGAPRDSAGDYRDPAQRASRIWMASMCTMPRASSGTNFNGVGTGRRRPRRLGKGPWKATGTLPPVKRVWRDLRRAVE